MPVSDPPITSPYQKGFLIRKSMDLDDYGKVFKHKFDSSKFIFTSSQI